MKYKQISYSKDVQTQSEGEIKTTLRAETKKKKFKENK